MTIPSSSPVYKHLVSRNLLRLKEFCDDCIELLVRDINSFDLNMILVMHNICMALLLDKTGEFRKEDAHITYSKHLPPSPDKISDLMLDFVSEIKNIWITKEIDFEIAAFALWRLNWIHPFEDGNGRISRAFCYILLTAKLGCPDCMNTLPEVIADNHTEYQELLRQTDLVYDDCGVFNKEMIEPLTNFLLEIYLGQNGYNLEEYDHDL